MTVPNFTNPELREVAFDPGYPTSRTSTFQKDKAQVTVGDNQFFVERQRDMSGNYKYRILAECRKGTPEIQKIVIDTHGRLIWIEIGNAGPLRGLGVPMIGEGYTGPAPGGE